MKSNVKIKGKKHTQNVILARSSQAKILLLFFTSRERKQKKSLSTIRVIWIKYILIHVGRLGFSNFNDGFKMSQITKFYRLN